MVASLSPTGAREASAYRTGGSGDRKGTEFRPRGLAKPETISGPRRGTDRDLPHAVVVGGNLNALGVVRSLAAGGVPVILAPTRRDEIAAWSRYARVEPVGDFTSPAMIDRLRAVRLRLDRKPFLILTDEDALATVSKYRAALSGDFIFDLPETHATAMLENKIALHEFATSIAFPTPETLAIRTADDLDSLESIGTPMVIKPADKSRVRGLPTEHALLAHDIPTARERCVRLLARGAQAVAQEWIGGRDSDIYFCLFYADATGEPQVMFTGRKLAIHPERTGSTAACVPAPEMRAHIEPLAREFARRAGMAGIGGVEFKRDRIRDRFVLIEPTVGRTDWQSEVATLAGVNLPLEGYRLATGAPIAPRRRLERALIWRSSLGRLPAPAPAGVPVFDGYWRRDDPMPAFAYYIRNRVYGEITQAAHGLISRILKGGKP